MGAVPAYWAMALAVGKRVGLSGPAQEPGGSHGSDAWSVGQSALGLCDWCCHGFGVALQLHIPGPDLGDQLSGEGVERELDRTHGDHLMRPRASGCVAVSAAVKRRYAELRSSASIGTWAAVTTSENKSSTTTV